MCVCRRSGCSSRIAEMNEAASRGETSCPHAHAPPRHGALVERAVEPLGVVTARRARGTAHRSPRSRSAGRSASRCCSAPPIPCTFVACRTFTAPRISPVQPFDVVDHPLGREALAHPSAPRLAESSPQVVVGAQALAGARRARRRRRPVRAVRSRRRRRPCRCRRRRSRRPAHRGERLDRDDRRAFVRRGEEERVERARTTRRGRPM